MNPFREVPDDWLDDLAACIMSAENEGVCADFGLAEALGTEFVRRGRRVPRPYSNGTDSAEDWLTFWRKERERGERLEAEVLREQSEAFKTWT